jgi:hypothetical protein
MITKRTINFWILFVILIIAAWLLGSVTQAGAQTYTVKCRDAGHNVKVHIIEVGDVLGHILGVGESARVLSCDDGSVATTLYKSMSDYTKGSGKTQLYGLNTYEDGSTTWAKAQFTVTANPDGKTAIWEGTFYHGDWPVRRNPGGRNLHRQAVRAHAGCLCSIFDRFYFHLHPAFQVILECQNRCAIKARKPGSLKPWLFKAV